MCRCSVAESGAFSNAAVWRLHIMLTVPQVMVSSWCTVCHACMSALAHVAWRQSWTFDLIWNMQLRKERDRLRHKMDMFKKTLSSELLTMQLRGDNGSGSM